MKNELLNIETEEGIYTVHTIISPFSKYRVYRTTVGYIEFMEYKFQNKWKVGKFMLADNKIIISLTIYILYL